MDFEKTWTNNRIKDRIIRYQDKRNQFQSKVLHKKVIYKKIISFYILLDQNFFCLWRPIYIKCYTYKHLIGPLFAAFTVFALSVSALR